MKILFVILIFFVLISAVCARNPDPMEFTVSDTAELLDAVKQMPWTGGKIYLKPGTYTVKDTIVFEGTSFLTIEGAGESTVIHKQDSGDLFLFRGNCWHNNIKNLALEGDTDAAFGSGIVFADDNDGNHCGNITIDSCRITGFAMSGIRFEGNGKNPQSSNVISRCNFMNNRSHQLYMRHSNDFHILQNQFGSGGGILPLSGCFLDHASAGTYSMNYHWDNQTGLIVGAGSNFNRIENNRFEESAASGLQIGEEGGEAAAYNIITGNTIHTNSKNNYGVYSQISAYNANNITFTGNQVFSWNHLQTASRYAVFISDSCQEWIIKDNIFRHFTEKAMITNKNGKHIIKDNIIGETVKKP